LAPELVEILSVPELVEGGAIPAFRSNLFLAEKARKRISTANEVH